VRPQNPRATNSSSGTRSTNPKNICWTCGEPRYHRDFPIEKERDIISTRKMTVGDSVKAHMIHAMINNHKAEHQSTVLETLGMIIDKKFIVLIDPEATESFIYSVGLKIINVKVIEQDEFRYVEMASGAKQKVGGNVKDCNDNLGDFVTSVNMYITILGYYDIVIGMD
jgi:hypothetical protein